MKVTMMLCDHVQVAEGKLFIAGGGWGITGPNPEASGLAILVDVPWDMANRDLGFALRLLDQDGNAVAIAGPLGAQLLALEGRFQVGRPPGVNPGTALPVPLAVNIPPLPLTPNASYTWVLEINGQTQDDWRVSFSTRGRRSDKATGPAS